MRDLREIEIDGFLSQAETLAQLSQQPAWEQYMDLLRDMRSGMLDELSRADVNDFRYWQGAANAIAEVLDRPARIVAAAADFTRAEEVDKRGHRPELRAIIGMGYDSEGDV